MFYKTSISKITGFKEKLKSSEIPVRLDVI